MNRRGRFPGRTLRTRLTAGLVIVLLVAFAVTGVATALFLRGFLVGRLDAQLADAGGRFSVSLEHGLVAPGGSDSDADNAVPGQSVGTLGVRLVGGRVTQAAVVDSDGDNSTPQFGAHDTSELAAVPVGGSPRSLHLDAVGDYRLQAVAGRDGDVQITGLPLHEVDETLARLITFEVVVFAAVVAVSATAAALIVRRTLRPLRAVADTAMHVSDLPLTDPATPLPSRIAPDHPTTEVDQVSVAFDHMLDHIRTALAARDGTEARLRQFVADASHELRTPLATIRAYSEFATRGGEPLPEPTSIALDRIDTAAARMATLVDDLLLLARLDAGRPLAVEPVDLTQLVVEAVMDARTAAPEHHWRLDLPDEPVETIGDDARLHQLLGNLLGNARNHTPAGTTVTVAVAPAPLGIDLTVTDDGPGIPGDLQPGLFDRFTRGDPARTAGHGSTGLGLAIAHGIAVAHGGSLIVASAPGRTRFTLHLPRVAAPVDARSDDANSALKTL